MSWLTKIALKKRWLTFLLVAIITGVSIWSTITLKMEMIPDIELPVTSIVAVYPQAKPEEVMNKVAVPIEEAIAGIEGLEQLISTCTEGNSFTYALFDYGTDMEKVNSTITQRLEEIDFPAEVRSLPETMPELQLKTNPQLFAIDINMIPMVILSVSGDVSAEELDNIAVNKVIPRLESIKGVYHVGIEGGVGKSVLVSLDPEKMNQYGLSTLQTAGILSIPEYTSLSQIENTPMGSDVLLLKDIASIQLGVAPGTSVSRTNGYPSVSILVMKEAEANTVLVANALIREVEDIKGTLGDEVEIVTVLDQSEYIENSIGDLTRSAIIGCVLAVVVVFLFLMAFRASLVTAISIPLSILISFLVMRWTGITINILTLSALAIAVGRVIDNSIVVLEVIYRRMQHGEEFHDAALNGIKEVITPITSSTIATVVIFIPLAFVGGIIGELFIPFALTITFAFVASLLVALVVIPPLCNFPISDKAKITKGDAWYQRIYTSILKWALNHRVITLVIATILFFGSFVTVPFIGTAFIPNMGEAMITVEIKMLNDMDLTVTESAAIVVEKTLDKNPEFLNYQTTIGTPSSFFGGFSAMTGSGSNTAMITVTLAQDADIEQEADELRQALDGVLENALITVTAGEAAMSEIMGGGLDISVRGDSYESVAANTELLFNEIKNIDGIADLEINMTNVEPKLSINLDPIKIMISGLSEQEIALISQDFLLMRFGGAVGKANIDGRDYDIFLESVVPKLTSVKMAKQFMVGAPVSIAIGDIADVELGEQPVTIQRIDQKLAASITGSITDENIGKINRVVQEKIDALHLGPGDEVTMGGVADMMGESFSHMFIAIIVAIGLAYLVILVTFRSFITPFIIMASLPLASVGALLGLLITGNLIGVSALMGILMLVGIVLTNAVVLITLVEQLRKEGMSTNDALIEGGRTRLRPILMTAITTMIAMLPLAMGLGEGTVMAAELAVVVIGGLFSSTLLTLLVIPVLYSTTHRLRRESNQR